MSWVDAVMTDDPVQNPLHFCDLSNFDGGMKDGIQNIRYSTQVDCEELYSKKKCKKMGKLGELVEQIRATKVFCKDNICRCGTPSKASCCMKICGNKEGCTFVDE